MTTGQSHRVFQHLRRAALRGNAGDPSDGQLLESFLVRHDETAFEALVRRHGPMVLGVCRRVTGNVHDAEDAFQATFLVLVRKAHSVVPREMVGNWLYGVACRTALRAKSAAAKRRLKERQVPPMCRHEADEALLHDLQGLLDQELSRLPDKYRVPVVLCELEGKSRKEAARLLGWPEGTLSCRLARARVLLAKRLARHGLPLSAGAVATLLSQAGASAAVPPALVTGTVRLGMLVAAGKTGAAAAVPAGAVALAEGVVKAMLLTKLKLAVTLLITVAFLGAGLTGFATSGPTDAEPGSRPVQASPAKDSGTKPAAADRVHQVGRAKPARDADLIQGTWSVVGLEQVNHEPTADEKRAYRARALKITITADRIIMMDKSEAKYRLEPTTRPKQMHLTVSGIAARALYQLNGDDLKICMGRAHELEPPRDFNPKRAAAGTFPTLWILKRDPAATSKPAAEKPAKEKVAPGEDLLQSQRDRLLIEEQHMAQIVQKNVDEARRMQGDATARALDLLRATLLRVWDNPDLSERARENLLNQLLAARRDLSQGK